MWVILLQKFKLNNKGASLIEIIATITIASIALLMIYRILANNIRQNEVNQEKSVNANVANSALSYIKGLDFFVIKNYYEDYAIENHAIIDSSKCSTLLQENQDFNEELCNLVLNPIINNKHFNESNLRIYIVPYNDPDKLSSLKSLFFEDEILEKYFGNLDISNYTPSNTNNNIIRVIVVVNSSINNRYDFLLEGVITND